MFNKHVLFFLFFLHVAITQITSLFPCLGIRINLKRLENTISVKREQKLQAIAIFLIGNIIRQNFLSAQYAKGKPNPAQVISGQLNRYYDRAVQNII